MYGVPTKAKELKNRNAAYISVSSIFTDISSVGIAAGYLLDGQGWIPCRSQRFFSSPQRPDRLCDPPSILSNGYRELSWSKTTGA
jgi:hypothetical protein